MTHEALRAMGAMPPRLLSALRDMALSALSERMRRCRIACVEDLLSTGDGCVDVVDLEAPSPRGMDACLITCSDVSWHEDGHVEFPLNHLAYLGTWDAGRDSHTHALLVAREPADWETVRGWNERTVLPPAISENVERIHFLPGVCAAMRNDHPHRMVSVSPDGQEHGMVFEPSPDSEASEPFRSQIPPSRRVGIFLSIGSGRGLEADEFLEICAAVRPSRFP